MATSHVEEERHVLLTYWSSQTHHHFTGVISVDLFNILIISLFEDINYKICFLLLKLYI